jgi:hypothetical protein
MYATNAVGEGVVTGSIRGRASRFQKSIDECRFPVVDLSMVRRCA